MKSKYFLSKLLLVGSFLTPLMAQATSIRYTVSNISDDTWEYSYTVANDSLDNEIEGLNVNFKLGLYENLSTALVPSGWDLFVAQPDPLLPDDGFYESFVLGIGIAPGDILSGFSVQFDYLGESVPGSQLFSILDPIDFSALDNGDTTPQSLSLLLRSGLNLFSYPGKVPAELATCRGLLDNLSGPDEEIESIGRLSASDQQFSTCSRVGGEDFDIVAGEGYMVRMRKAKEVVLSVDATCPEVTLKEGVNLIGHPVSSKTLSCYSLLESLGESVAASLQRLNSKRGSFETCAFVDKGDSRVPMGVNFSIRVGEGYLLHFIERRPDNASEVSLKRIGPRPRTDHHTRG